MAQARPHGPEAVRAALIDACIELFADRIPQQVTLHDIAMRAKVNQGLIHEYFRTKDELIKATIDQLSEIRAATMESAQDAVEGVCLSLGFHEQYPASARLLAWWLMEGRDITELDLLFETDDRLVAAGYGPEDTAQVDLRIVSSGVGLLILGSVVFRGYVDARDLSDLSDQQIADEFARLAGSLHEWNRGDS